MKDSKKTIMSKNTAIHLIIVFFLIALTILLFDILLVSEKRTPVPALNHTLEPVKEKVKPPLYGAYLGVSLYDQNYDDLLFLEKRLRKHFAIVGIYQSWGETNNMFNASWAGQVARNGGLPLVTWEPWKPVSGYDRSEGKVDQQNFRLSRIADGAFDSYIKAYAMQVKKYRNQIMIRFAHEMNGNWYSWGSAFNSPQDYIKVWRHVHDIFTSVGATNVTWVWSPNELYTDAAVPYSNQIKRFYPGDAYVDWVGFSAFNWASRYKQNIWRNPQDMYPETLKELETLGKPVMIAETASADADTPDMKAGWIRALSVFIKKTPEIKAVIWFNAVDNGIDWRIENTNISAAAFTNSFGDWFKTIYSP